MTTVNQGMSIEEIERVVAQRVANAIEAIAIYETKTNLAHKSMSQTEREEKRKDCLEQKNQNHENQIKGTKARGVVHVFGGGETEQDLNNIEDEIEA
nr:hypothetical protein [Tanacetum cinerariifolium]